MLRVALLIVASIFLATTYAQTSLCDKYGSTAGTPDVTLVGSVVNGTLSAVTSDSLKRYFDGTFLPGSTNYLAPANAGSLNHLRDLLIQYFGAALGCSDNTIAAYSGRNMSLAHANVPIGIVQFNQFNNDVIMVLKNAGVSDADRATILSVLNGLQSQICNQPNCYPSNYPNPSICSKYSIALNMTDYDLVDYVVVKVLTNITTNPPTSQLLKYFNGQISGTTDYTTNAGALNMLHNHLTQFFGHALGCMAPNYPAYQGVDMKTAHQNLPITKADFDYFNLVLLGVLSDAGVSSDDRLKVSALLNGTQDSVCTNCVAATPVPATPAPAPVSTTNNSGALFVSALAVVVSVVCLLL